VSANGKFGGGIRHKVPRATWRRRIDTPQELLYYRHGGILEYVLRQLAGK